MDALLMCGGRGTRLGGATEKPMTPIAGRPMVDRVCDALAGSRVETTHAVVSPHATETRAHLVGGGPESSVIDAPGDGYVADLRYAMERVGGGDATARPFVTVAADLPLLDPEAVNGVLDAARAADDDDAPTALTVCVPAARKRELGVSADAATEIDGREVVPAGINVVGGGGDATESDGGDDAESDGDAAVHLTEDARVAVNVNYPSDVRVAERLLADGEADD